MTWEPIPGYRKAIVKTTLRDGSDIRQPAYLARYTAHCTVGIRLYDYPWPPHTTVAWGGGKSFPAGVTLDLSTRFVVDGDPIVRLGPREVLRLQHVDITKAAYALLGPGAPPRSPVETNHAGHNLQCEFTLPPVRQHRDLRLWEYRIIAREIANQIHGLRLAKDDPTLINPKHWPEFPGSEGWGYAAPTRMSPADYIAFDGVLSHSLTPGNDHWDPGRWRRGYVRRRVLARLERLRLRDFGT